MLLKDIIIHIDGESCGDLETAIEDIAYDSRKVKPGTLFVAIKGFKSDGHDYIKQAISNGACAVIVEEVREEIEIPYIKVKNSRNALALVSKAFFDDPASKMKLIGVTGTNGKTTVTYLIKSILEVCGKKVGLIGTNQNMIGSLVLPSERTTPESYELQKIFSDMVKAEVEYVVMEVSSHSLDLSRVEGCNFEVGVFTNLTQDHLDFHITMENYLNAKTKLFNQSKVGIINTDDKNSGHILKNGSCKMVTFGIKSKADVTAKDLEISEKGVKFSVNINRINEVIYLRIPGLFSVYNALGSIAACMALGIDLQDIKAGLLSAKGVPGRAQLVRTNKDFTIIIDYAHTPDGLQNIIAAVRGFSRGKVITVFGCGGDRDKTKRPIMGKIAAELSDISIITSDNPRTEEPSSIIEDILKGIEGIECQYRVVENRLKAIEYAIEIAEKNDIIILAGKGHETYQEIHGIKYDFNEEEIVLSLLSSEENKES